MTKSPRKNVSDVGIELGAACMPSELASDRATAPGYIIVKFTTYNARNRLFQERKSLRETDNEDLNNIFLNEDLTKRRSKILFEARKLRRSNKLKSAFSSDGKIIVRDKKRQKVRDNCLR